MRAIIFAGGLGTRLRSVVSDRPKPMAPVQGKPFLIHLLHYWKNQGITEFVVSVGYLSEVIVEEVGSSFEGLPIRYVREDRPLGTGGALLHCLQTLADGKSCLVINGDTFMGVRLDALREAAERLPAASVIFTLRRMENQARFSGLEFDGERITAIRRRENHSSSSTWMNAGVYLFSKDISGLGLFPEKIDSPISLEDTIFPTLIEKGHILRGVPSDAEFIDIGLPEDFARAQTMSVFGASASG